MNDNVSKSLNLGVNTYLTILLLAIGLTFFLKGKTILNFLDGHADQTINSINKSTYTKYDNTLVTGSEVLNTISEKASDKFLIIVQTKANPSGAAYNSGTGYNIFDPSDPNFIDINAKFNSSLVTNTNRSISQIVFKETD